VSSARVVEAAGSAVKVVPDGQAPRAGSAVKVKRSDVQVVPPSETGQPSAAMPSPRPAELPAGGGPNVAPASSPPEVSPGHLAEWVELPNGARVQRETVEAAADLLALHTKQRNLSGLATEAAVREAVGTARFRDAKRLLGTTKGRATAEAVLATRQDLTARNAPLPDRALGAPSTTQPTDGVPQELRNMLERAPDAIAAKNLAQRRRTSYPNSLDAPTAVAPGQGAPASELGLNAGIHLPWGGRRLSHRGPVHSALNGLPTVTRDFWLKEKTQHKVFAKLYDAGALDLNTAGPLLQEIDTMVVEGMRALGLDRMPLRKLTLTPMQDIVARRWVDGQLDIGYEALHRYLYATPNPSMILHGWIHDSVHTRLPWASQYKVEFTGHTGYEDGLAEALSRHIVVDQARLWLLDESVNTYHVLGYRTLAQAAGVGELDLLRAAFRHSPGAVRENFVAIVNRVRGAAGGPPIRDPERFRRVADEVFKVGNEGMEIASLTWSKLWFGWKEALR